MPVYVYGAECAAQNGGNLCPGGRGFNRTPVSNLPKSKGVAPYPECQAGAVVGYGAFCITSVASPGSRPVQGDAGRNLLRGFPLRQFALDVHRDFRIAERARLRFHANIFNVFNQPNFSAPQNFLFLPNFGHSNSMMNSSFGTGSVSSGGGNSPLYSLGGPRSVQLALKVIF